MMVINGYQPTQYGYVKENQPTHYGYATYPLWVCHTYPLWVLNLPNMGSPSKNNRNNSIEQHRVTADFCKNRKNDMDGKDENTLFIEQPIGKEKVLSAAAAATFITSVKTGQEKVK